MPGRKPRNWTRGAARTALALAFLVSAGSVRAADAETVGLALTGEEAEVFLRTAEVIAREDIPEGVTHPQRLTLSDGKHTLRASWKTIDEHKPGLWRGENGSYQFDFRDSWKHEVAAYELDKLLGLGMVPPTVERRIDGRRGAVQLWVEGVMTGKARRDRKIEPEGPRHIIRWQHQIHCVRLFHQLTYNTDLGNLENILVSPDFQVWVIDASRAFRIQRELIAPDDLKCFSRAALKRLEALDEAVIEETMGDLLSDLQVEGLLARRDRILTLVKVRLVEKGPGQVLFQ
jgi:hypothetical protein